jgi:hypothetical protein
MTATCPSWTGHHVPARPPAGHIQRSLNRHERSFPRHDGELRAISPRPGNGGKPFLSGAELSENTRLGTGRERRVRTGDQVGERTGASGAYL